MTSPVHFRIVAVTQILGGIEEIIFVLCGSSWERLADLEEYPVIVSSPVNLQMQNKTGNKGVLCGEASHPWHRLYFSCNPNTLLAPSVPSVTGDDLESLCLPVCLPLADTPL